MAEKSRNPKLEVAFHTAKKDKVFEAVQAIKEVLGLSQGSVFAPGNPYATYDLYELLDVYINNPEARIKIHGLIEDAKHENQKQASE